MVVALEEKLDRALDSLDLLERKISGIAIAIFPRAPKTGAMPRAQVWSKNKAKLYRYESTRKHATPILLVYALINKPYILDLLPGNSLIEFLCDEGYDVFLLDWGIPGEEDANLRFDNYILDYLPRAVREVKRHSGQDHFTLFGYCMGGTISAMYASLHPDDGMRNLVLLTTPIDFSGPGLFSAWLDPRFFDVERIAQTYRLVPPTFLEMGAKLLKPLQNYVGPYVKLLRGLEDEKFVEGWQAMHQWVHDGVPFPAAAYRQWVTEFYQENRLVEDNLELGGRPVRLADITCPVLNVYAEHDHIVRPEQATVLLDKISSTDAENLAIKAGHVGVVSGRSARVDFFPKLNAWLEPRSSLYIRRQSARRLDLGPCPFAPGNVC